MKNQEVISFLTDASHLKLGTRQGFPFLSLLFYIILEDLAREIRKEKKDKQWKKNLSLFAGDISYIYGN